MTAETQPTSAPKNWMVHDVIIGLLAGAGVGSILGVFLAVRVSDNNLITLVGAVIGAIVGVILLMRSHQKHPDRFMTPGVIVAWILLILSAFFIASLIFAIANFT